MHNIYKIHIHGPNYHIKDVYETRQRQRYCLAYYSDSLDVGIVNITHVTNEFRYWIDETHPDYALVADVLGLVQ